MNLAEVLDRVQEIALVTGKIQLDGLGNRNREIAAKSSAIDLVTDMDQKSEKMITQYLHRLFPSHGILAEESGQTAGSHEYLWVVDPLDGTTNYAQGLPIFAVSIALQHRGETVLGVIYAPGVGQLFTAIRGKGAFLNGTKIQVSAKTELIQCVLATGFPYDIATHPANNINYFSEIVLKSRAVRRMGAAAYDLACVAAGKLDGFWELSLSPWDVAAGMLLVEEAGGQVVHFRADRGVSIIAGNAKICEKIHDELKRVDSR